VPLSANRRSTGARQRRGFGRTWIQEDYIRAASENGASVLVGISRRPSGSTEEIAAQARQILEEFRQRYPDIQFSARTISRTCRRIAQELRDAIALGPRAVGAGPCSPHDEPLSALVAAIRGAVYRRHQRSS